MRNATMKCLIAFVTGDVDTIAQSPFCCNAVSSPMTCIKSSQSVFSSLQTARDLGDLSLWYSKTLPKGKQSPLLALFLQVQYRA